ncbi:MAG: NADH-quinone oxidoreductase subunit A [Chloroflexi bacterium]|nr:NADH-quinone oxidoreductase subunit A [Chloroflexota bacterium]
MLEDYFRQYAVIAIFGVVAVLVPLGMILASNLAGLVHIRPSRPRPPNWQESPPPYLKTYESGFEPIGGPWRRIHVRYYTFGLLFVIFDVETVFLFPWAVEYGPLSARFGIFALAEAVIFIAILALGWAYAWRKRAMEWA